VELTVHSYPTPKVNPLATSTTAARSHPYNHEQCGLPITAAGIKHLAGLHNLSELDLWRTRADDEDDEILRGSPG
jgi:hypothetical protein